VSWAPGPPPAKSGPGEGNVCPRQLAVSREEGRGIGFVCVSVSVCILGGKWLTELVHVYSIWQNLGIHALIDPEVKRSKDKLDHRVIKCKLGDPGVGLYVDTTAHFL